MKRYYDALTDVWKFIKRHYLPSGDDAWWDDVMDDASETEKSYKGFAGIFFARILRDALYEFQRILRGEGTGQTTTSFKYGTMDDALREIEETGPQKVDVSFTVGNEKTVYTVRRPQSEPGNDGK